MSRQEVTNTIRWTVTVANPLPSFPLDRQAKQINRPAAFISQSIDQYLRIKSIKANFDSENATASCKASDFMRFNIYLYAGSVENSTVVEIIRNKGSGFLFCKERDNIMNVARNGIDAWMISQDSSTMLSNSSRGGKTPNVGSLPSSFLNNYVPPSLSDLENTLLRASDRLHSNHLDTTLFILQNLASLTMPHSFVPKNAHQISVLIMNNTHDIRDQIMAIYSTHQKHLLSHDGATQESSRTMMNCDHFDEISEQICSASLTILTNGILAMYKRNKQVSNIKEQEYVDRGCEEKKDDDNCHFEQEEQDQDSFNSFIDMFVPLLIEAVRNHAVYTSNAYLALKGLEAMVIHSPRTRDLLCGMKGDNDDCGDVGALVEEARLYGCREHLKLERAATDALEVMSQFEVVGMID